MTLKVVLPLSVCQAVLSYPQTIDDYGKYVGIYGAKGLAWMKVNDLEAGMEGLQSPILKFLNEDVAKGIVERSGAQSGDILLFGADSNTVVTEALGALRLKLGEDLALLEGDWKPLGLWTFLCLRSLMVSFMHCIIRLQHQEI